MVDGMKAAGRSGARRARPKRVTGRDTGITQRPPTLLDGPDTEAVLRYEDVPIVGFAFEPHLGAWVLFNAWTGVAIRLGPSDEARRRMDDATRLAIVATQRALGIPKWKRHLYALASPTEDGGAPPMRGMVAAQRARSRSGVGGTLPGG